MIDFVMSRLKEASSSRGLIWLLAGLGITLNPSNIQTILTYATGAVGVLGMAAPDARAGGGFDPVGYVVGRLKEASTYRGLAWLGAAWGLSKGFDVSRVVPMAMAAAGGIGAFIADPGNKSTTFVSNPLGYLFERLGESSTYRGLVWLLTSAGVLTGSLSLAGSLPLAAIGSGLVGLFSRDKRAP